MKQLSAKLKNLERKYCLGLTKFRLSDSAKEDLQVHRIRNGKESNQGIFKVKNVSFEVIEEDCRAHGKGTFVPNHLYNLK